MEEIQGRTPLEEQSMVEMPSQQRSGDGATVSGGEKLVVADNDAEKENAVVATNRNASVKNGGMKTRMVASPARMRLENSGGDLLVDNGSSVVAVAEQEGRMIVETNVEESEQCRLVASQDDSSVDKQALDDNDQEEDEADTEDDDVDDSDDETASVEEEPLESWQRKPLYPKFKEWCELHGIEESYEANATFHRHYNKARFEAQDEKRNGAYNIDVFVPIESLPPPDAWHYKDFNGYLSPAPVERQRQQQPPRREIPPPTLPTRRNPTRALRGTIDSYAPPLDSLGRRQDLQDEIQVESPLSLRSSVSQGSQDFDGSSERLSLVSLDSEDDQESFYSQESTLSRSQVSEEDEESQASQERKSQGSGIPVAEYEQDGFSLQESLSSRSQVTEVVQEEYEQEGLFASRTVLDLVSNASGGRRGRISNLSRTKLPFSTR